MPALLFPQRLQQAAALDTLGCTTIDTVSLAGISSAQQCLRLLLSGKGRPPQRCKWERTSAAVAGLHPVLLHGHAVPAVDGGIFQYYLKPQVLPQGAPVLPLQAFTQYSCMATPSWLSMVAWKTS